MKVDWISVKDRLPPRHLDVLVRYRYTDMPNRPWDIAESWHDRRDEQNGGWAFGSCDYAEVSHWMHKSTLLRLPKP